MDESRLVILEAELSNWLETQGTAVRDLRIEINGGLPCICGAVPSYAEKRRTFDAFSQLAGNRAVNRLRVEPASLVDDELARRVSEAIRLFAVAGSEVMVTAQGGSVTISGRARGARAAASAGAVAAAVDGVREVRNRLVAPTEDSQQLIAESLKSDFQELLGNDRIGVEVRGSGITLTGQVDNEEIRRRAEEITAWHAGTPQVTNSITLAAADAPRPLG